MGFQAIRYNKYPLSNSWIKFIGNAKIIVVSNSIGKISNLSNFPSLCVHAKNIVSMCAKYLKKMVHT